MEPKEAYELVCKFLGHKAEVLVARDSDRYYGFFLAPEGTDGNSRIYVGRYMTIVDKNSKKVFVEGSEGSPELKDVKWKLMRKDDFGEDEPDETLAHHGIKGQKHGVENGPPYPLYRQAKYRNGGSYNGRKKYKLTADARQELGLGKKTARAISKYRKERRQSQIDTAKKIGNLAKKVGTAAIKAPGAISQYRKDRKQAKIDKILERGSKKKILKNMRRMSNEELVRAQERLKALKATKDITKGDKAAGLELAEKGLEYLKTGNAYLTQIVSAKDSIDKLQQQKVKGETNSAARKIIENLKIGNTKDLDKNLSYLTTVYKIESMITGNPDLDKVSNAFKQQDGVTGLKIEESVLNPSVASPKDQKAIEKSNKKHEKLIKKYGDKDASEILKAYEDGKISADDVNVLTEGINKKTQARNNLESTIVSTSGAKKLKELIKNGKLSNGGLKNATDRLGSLQDATEALKRKPSKDKPPAEDTSSDKPPKETPSTSNPDEGRSEGSVRSQAFVLLSNNTSYKKIAETLGIPISQVRNYADLFKEQRDTYRRRSN